jgi:hypothetical protein
VYTREVWAQLCSAISLVQPVLEEASAMEQWLGERKLLPKEQRRGFDALFLLVSWLSGKSGIVRSLRDLLPCRRGYYPKYVMSVMFGLQRGSGSSLP